MTRFALTTLALAATSASAKMVASGPKAPVVKVIQLLTELKSKVQGDLSTEEKQMSEYTQFCDDEQSAREYAIKTAKREIDGYNAVIEEANGKIQDYDANLQDISSVQTQKNKELIEAKDVRKNENEDFVAAEKELVEAVDTLERAIVIIKREMSLAQTGAATQGDMQEKLEAIKMAMGNVIQAAWLDAGSRRSLQMFMEQSMNADDELTLKQPQAIVKNYENHSSSIVETLEEMKDKAQSALSKLRREEQKSRHAFELLAQSLNDAIAINAKELEEVQANRAASAGNLASAQGDLQETQAAKVADEEYLKNLVLDCKNKATEWTARQKSATDEISALTQGIEVLSGKFGFIQMKTHSKSNEYTNYGDNSDRRDRLVELMKKMGREYKSFGLMQLASAAMNDPFVKVRGLIEEMIANLQQQAQEEADHNSFCKEEMGKARKTQKLKAQFVDKYQARIDTASTGIQELKADIAELHAEIAELDKAVSEADAIRMAEEAEYKKASTDYKESSHAIVQAIQVLKEFYGESVGSVGEALLQQPEFQSSQTDSSHTIVAILETAESDFSKLAAEAEATESSAVEAYKTLKQNAKVTKAAKKAAIKGKTSEMKQLEVALVHHKDDHETTSKELSAVIEYLAKLKPQCENKAMTFEERKARREAEIEGLREALSILEGEGVPTGAFIQKKFMGRRV